MNREDWGIKRVCLSCGARFYDFSKSPIICPLCAGVFDPDYLSRKKTKNFQEKNSEVIDDIDIVVDEDDLIEESTDELSEDEENIVLTDDKN
ncbi:MAG: TIGR02300 family protein [Holosporaceae bacterium]|jgi:uncharacterized protein (TIGR02300 family)|nr:TIGR02300 family protein [Holosporaceae bacterium]